MNINANIKEYPERLTAVSQKEGGIMKKILLGASIFILVMAGVVSVAAIELPRTGQTKCYSGSGVEISCAGTGQDGATQAGVALPVDRFTPYYSDLTAVDNLTGLMWTIDSRTPDPYDPYQPVCASDWRTMIWEGPPLYAALTYIECLNTNNFLGYNDWRLPNRWELRSLILDYSTKEPALPTGHPFINVEEGWRYWSSTSCTSYLVSDAYDGHDKLPEWEAAWVVNMWDGSEYCHDKTLSCEGGSPPCDTPIFAWPVRAGQTNGNTDPAYPVNIPKTGQTASFAPSDDGNIQAGVAWPDPRFTVTYCNATGPCPNQAADCDEDSTGEPTIDPTNDVVTDNLTGLIWIRLPDNIHRTWVEALAYANNLSRCGYSNWRLPNINELQSMIHNGEPDTAVWLNTAPPFYFIGVESFFHWSSTTDRTSTSKAMVVDMWDGSIENHPKTEYYYAWPVRLPGALLSVLKAGNGLGTVSSAPLGINCGSDCSEVFLEGTDVTLTAEADPDSTFAGWSGACTGTGTCTITMNTDTEVTASFTASLSGCTYSISPGSKTFSVNGKTVGVKVVASGNGACPEPVTTISAGTNWISAEPTSWQNNAGVVTVTVSPSNSSVQRIATVGIGNATFTATQKAKKCTTPIFTPSSETWPQAGGTGSFAVSFSSKSAIDCIWSAVPDPKTNIGGWFSTDSRGTADGTVNYEVLSNDSGYTRKGEIDVLLLQKPTKKYRFKIIQLN
jgi:hypothetical protein